MMDEKFVSKFEELRSFVDEEMASETARWVPELYYALYDVSRRLDELARLLPSKD